MTYVVGLTGSIGMGKSTTAHMFADEGIPVWDADACVHELYAPGGTAVEAIRALAPDAIVDGTVSRDVLRAEIAKTPTLLDQINAAVHPLVQSDRQAFLDAHSGKLVLLDIPLLFETGADAQCDFIVVVSAPPEVQKARVLNRGEMTQADFQNILSRQMPDHEKRQRADHVILTLSLDETRAAVTELISKLRDKLDHA